MCRVPGFFVETPRRGVSTPLIQFQLGDLYPGSPLPSLPFLSTLIRNFPYRLYARKRKVVNRKPQGQPALPSRPG